MLLVRFFRVQRMLARSVVKLYYTNN